MAGRLLLDENLSPRLVKHLAATFPGSAHIRDVVLKGQSDHQIWRSAADNGLTILTKDDDFRGLSLLRGAPPKVIWLVIGNTSTADTAQIVIENLFDDDCPSRAFCIGHRCVTLHQSLEGW